MLEKDKQPYGFEIIKGVCLDYPKKKKEREVIFELAKQKGINVIILKNRRKVKDFCISQNQ